MTPSFLGRPGAFICASILAWLLVLPALAGAAGLTPAGSFAADGRIARERKIPILVFYSRDGCKWCDLARDRYLVPLSKDPAWAGRVLIREVELDGDFETALTDFGGRTTTHTAFARTRRVRLTPTIDFLDDQGMRLAEPIVGVRLPDYYGTFIERGIEESLAKLRPESK